jgi:hypothetical protein
VGTSGLDERGETMLGKVSKRFFLVLGLTGSILAAGSVSAAEERALTVRTRTLTPPPGGYLYCIVYATSTGPIGIVAKILNEGRADITAYGTGFRASPDVTGTDLYYAEETAGTVIDDAGYCKGAVTGARKNDIRVKLTAHDPNGEQVDVVTR